MPSRREFLTICGGVGIASSFFVGALYALSATSPSEPNALQPLANLFAECAQEILRGVAGCAQPSHIIPTGVCLLGR